jgi:hypothetical protein
MIDSKVFDLSRRMTDVALSERWDSVLESITLSLGQHALGGLGRSGAAGQAVGRICGEEARYAVQLAWQTLWRAALNVGMTPVDDVAREFKAEIRTQTAEHFERLRKTLVERLRPMGINFSERLDRFVRSRDLALTAVDAEVDLAVASAERRGSTDGTSTVYQFYAPVGAVMTGANSSASIIQNMGAQAKTDLGAALDRLREALGRATDVREEHQKGELVELVREAREELDRPRPNGWRLISVLQGIGGAVQTIGSALPAYETLKTVAGMAGIQLP